MESPKAFGKLFKARRKELGLTLREFCRKHELDAGNISRMERGLMPPPQSEDKLAEYAQMLDIKRDSDTWERFSIVGAVCAGRIPGFIMDNAELIQALPAVFSVMRNF